MRHEIKEDKPEQKKAPAYVIVTSAILVVSTIITMATYRQRQKTYEQLAAFVETFRESVDDYQQFSETFRESVDDYQQSSENVVESNERLRKSMDAMRELAQ